MGMTNLEWLYEHDVYVNSFAKTMACLRGFSTDSSTANEWLRQEHSEPNPDCSAMLYKMFTENMKHEPCSHYEPKDDAVAILREAARNLSGYHDAGEALRRLTDTTNVYYALEALADMVERDYVRRDAIEEVMDNDRALVEENAKLASELEAAKLQIGQSDAPKSAETAENDASKDDIRDFDDSREKLEADVLAYLTPHEIAARLLDNAIFGWLDRQEAITKREWCDEQGFWNCAEDAVMLSAQVVQLTAERDELTAELDAAKQQISRFDAPKSVETSENPASKCEISDFDVWNVAYEIYCAGGYVDNGNEPNPPTDGIRELLDRQAAITAEETSNAWEEYRDATQREITELTADNDRLAKLLSKSLEEYSKLEAERDKLKELNGYHAAQYELASEDCDRLQAQVDELTNAGRKMSTELANMQDYITKVRAGRERYRSMCSEMATKIHDALMVMDEGVA